MRPSSDSRGYWTAEIKKRILELAERDAKINVNAPLAPIPEGEETAPDAKGGAKKRAAAKKPAAKESAAKKKPAAKKPSAAKKPVAKKKPVARKRA